MSTCCHINFFLTSFQPLHLLTSSLYPQHLLRQMLAKDYRTRCTLDSIVIDDWVTFEGSEPLFDIADFSGTSFPGKKNVCM